MNGDKRYRITFDTTKEHYRKIGILIPHGLRNALFETFVEAIIPLIEEHGTKIIAALISKRIEISEIVDVGNGRTD